MNISVRLDNLKLGLTDRGPGRVAHPVCAVSPGLTVGGNRRGMISTTESEEVELEAQQDTILDSTGVC